MKTIILMTPEEYDSLLILATEGLNFVGEDSKILRAYLRMIYQALGKIDECSCKDYEE